MGRAVDMKIKGAVPESLVYIKDGILTRNNNRTNNSNTYSGSSRKESGGDKPHPKSNRVRHKKKRGDT